ncbi:GNAT family N-acetyltransferase [Salinisphaera sp. RV14]|uniref:GNAT family N-acetyltransferase n=1 Tax=Salinisphaera sp. RV14 TaxID=3454140 RepID=UPI003F84A410
MTAVPHCGDDSIRRAEAPDLDALMALERACFACDAQSRRSMAHLIGRAHGDVRVMDEGGRIVAAAVLLYRRGTRVARLYSIAVAPAARGRGLAGRLIDDAEQCARAAGCARLSAEARWSNRASRALFAACGFSETQRLADYYGHDPGRYEDGVRLVKRLLSGAGPVSP